MAEDQGINGAIWNNEAAILLKRLGWEQVGDSEIDIPTDEDKYRGIDRIFKYQDARRYGSRESTVFLEAKRYNTTSFNSVKLLEEWLKTLNTKLTSTRNSLGLRELYPSLADTVISSGLIVLWFADTALYPTFQVKFRGIIEKAKLPNISHKDSPNRIYVIDNYDILRLASMVLAIEEYNSKNDLTLEFYYPQSDYFKKPASRNNVLTLDYMFSKAVLAEAIKDNKTHRVVFYFGSLNLKSFDRLRALLNHLQFIDKDKPLTIYRYKSDIDFRKIESQVVGLFSGIEINIESMELFSDLPKFMRLH